MVFVYIRYLTYVLMCMCLNIQFSINFIFTKRAFTDALFNPRLRCENSMTSQSRLRKNLRRINSQTYCSVMLKQANRRRNRFSPVLRRFFCLPLFAPFPLNFQCGKSSFARKHFIFLFL